MPILDPNRTLRTLRKTPALLAFVLRGLSAERARACKDPDGDAGWSAQFVVCHLNDYEDVFALRVALVLTQVSPKLPGLDNEALIAERDYAHTNFADELASVLHKRQQLMTRLESLSSEQFFRVGVHPEFGEGTLLHILANAAMHDVDHLEQLARMLR